MPEAKLRNGLGAVSPLSSTVTLLQQEDQIDVGTGIRSAPGLGSEQDQTPETAAIDSPERGFSFAKNSLEAGRNRVRSADSLRVPLHSARAPFRLVLVIIPDMPGNGSVEVMPDYSTGRVESERRGGRPGLSVGSPFPLGVPQ